MMNTYKGSCHCGAIRVVLHSSLPPEELVPHSDANASNFHWKNDGVWIADPQGSLEVRKTAEERHYRIGTPVDFCFCGICGTLCYATIEYDGNCFGVVRAKIFDKSIIRLEKIVDNNFTAESPEEGKKRRMKTWTPVFFQ